MIYIYNKTVMSHNTVKTYAVLTTLVLLAFFPIAGIWNLVLTEFQSLLFCAVLKRCYKTVYVCYRLDLIVPIHLRWIKKEECSAVICNVITCFILLTKRCIIVVKPLHIVWMTSYKRQYLFYLFYLLIIDASDNMSCTSVQILLVNIFNKRLAVLLL